MFHTWHDLLFLHWRFDPQEIQPLLPEDLTVETFDGSAWVGLVPFGMKHVRPSGMPSIPYFSNFLELNIRTYAVDRNGIPGVWFTSLNASRWLAVKGARISFGLPYHWARMRMDQHPDGRIDYDCRRFTDSRHNNSHFAYLPTGEAREAAPGTLEFFLVERYVLFSQAGQGPLRTGRVHHEPYQIQPVQLFAWDAHLLSCDQMIPPERPPDHVAFARQVNVEVFPLQRA